jgi:hypothetical protein
MLTSGSPLKTDTQRSVPLTDSCAAANSISDQQFFDRAEASLPEFELASALESAAGSPKESANRSFFGHTLKTVSCI